MQSMSPEMIVIRRHIRRENWRQYRQEGTFGWTPWVRQARFLAFKNDAPFPPLIERSGQSMTLDYIKGES